MSSLNFWTSSLTQKCQKFCNLYDDFILTNFNFDKTESVNTKVQIQKVHIYIQNLIWDKQEFLWALPSAASSGLKSWVQTQSLCSCHLHILEDVWDPGLSLSWYWLLFSWNCSSHSLALHQSLDLSSHLSWVQSKLSLSQSIWQLFLGKQARPN